MVATVTAAAAAAASLFAASAAFLSASACLALALRAAILARLERVTAATAASVVSVWPERMLKEKKKIFLFIPTFISRFAFAIAYLEDLLQASLLYFLSFW